MTLHGSSVITTKAGSSSSTTQTTLIRVSLRKSIPQCRHRNIIITTRNPASIVYVNPSDSCCEVEEMPAADAIELPYSSSDVDKSDTNDAQAEALVKGLGHLPLAIRLAAAYIQQSPGLHFQGYLDLLESNSRRRELLVRFQATSPSFQNQHALVSDSHAKEAVTAYATWELIFAKLTPQEQRFRASLLFSHYNGIYEDIFKHAYSRAVIDRDNNVPVSPIRVEGRRSGLGRRQKS